jgi:hypothetical protein
MLCMSAVKRLRWAREAKINKFQPKSPVILTTSNPSQRADIVNRRTSDSSTVCCRTDKTGINRIRLVGIVSVFWSIEMPDNSRRKSQRATMPETDLYSILANVPSN